MPTTEYSEEFKQKWKWYYSFNMSYDQVTPTFVMTSISMQEHALRDIHKIAAPVLMAEADEDKVVCNERMQRYFAELSAKNPCAEYLRMVGANHTTCVLEP